MFKLVPVAIATTALGAACAAHHAVTTGASPDRTEKSYDMKVGASGARHLEIDAPVAEIKLTTSATDLLTVHAVRWTKDPNSADGKRWMDDSNLVSSRNGDDLLVKDTTSSGLHNLNGGLTLTIEAPADLEVAVHVNAGTLESDGSFRSTKFRIDAGQISSKFSRCPQDPSTINVEAGEVNLKLGRDFAGKVTAKTEVGEVNGLGSVKRDGDDDVKLGGSVSGSFGVPGGSIKVHVSMGSITVDSPNRPTQVSEVSSGGVAAEALAQPEDLATAATQIRDAVIADDDQDRGQKERDEDIDKAIKEAMKEVRESLKDIQPEVDKALKDAQPEIERAQKMAREQAKKAMKEAQAEMEQSMKDVGPEIAVAMAKAEKEMERATKEFDSSKGDMKHMDAHTRAAVKEAMKAARIAMKEAMESVRESMKHLHEEMNDDSSHDRD